MTDATKTAKPAPAAATQRKSTPLPVARPGLTGRVVVEEHNTDPTRNA